MLAAKLGAQRSASQHGGGNRPSIVPFRAPARAAAENLHRVEVAETRHWLEKHERGHMAGFFRRVARGAWRRFNKLNAPVVYPWSPSCPGTEQAHELHRVAARLVREEARGVLPRLWLATKAVGWLPLATAASIPVLMRNGPFVRDRHGETLGAQWLDLIDAAWRHGIFPTEYYHHRVYRGAARNDKARYLNEREIDALVEAANRGTDAMQLDDLAGLFESCRASGVPVPRTYAMFGHNRSEGDPEALPRKDLYFRPLRWDGHATAQVWRWNPQAAGWTHRSETLGGPALFERLRTLAAGRPHLLQDYLRNHPDVERFSAGGLCSVRIATGLSADGDPVPLFAALHLPACDASGASTPAGELHAGIDVRTGTLQAAWGEFVSDGEFASHPGTGAVIDGVTLPQWRTALDLALRLHRECGGVPFAGWEIGLSAAGAVLLDAGSRWSVFHHVLPSDTEFAALCLQRLKSASRGGSSDELSGSVFRKPAHSVSQRRFEVADAGQSRAEITDANDS